MGDTTADAVPNGVRLTELITELPLSRGSVFELLKVLSIDTAKGPGPGGRGRVAWVSDADADRLRDAAKRVDAGKVRIADLASGLQRLPTRQTLRAASVAASAHSANPDDPAPFLARLEAADRAIRSGLGLTTNETAWILGVKPVAAVAAGVTRGGITATRTGFNCWLLTRSAESANPG